MAAAAAADAGAAAEFVPVALAGRWEVDPLTPLPAFDRRSAQAFACRDRHTPGRRLLALICPGGVPFRADAARMLKEAAIPGLLTPRDFGPMDWPPQQARCLALIYDQPGDARLAATWAQREATSGEREPWRRLLRPLVRALHALAAMGIPHRGIRPHNLWSLDATESGVVLGDALAGPAGYDQPAAFETVERAMAEPAGRGEGTAADDVFALGVTLLALAGGGEPGGHRSDDDLLVARIDRGSYLTLTDGLRVPVPLVEPLRGMLADDPAERWSVRDLQMWLDGGRPTPKRLRPTRTPGAPFVFAGKPHFGLRALALALTRNVLEAARVIRSGGLESWLRRGLHNSTRSKRLADLAAGVGRSAGEPSAHADEALVARVALLLDPDAPIRYRDMSFAADGLGPAIARRLVAGENVQAMAEAIALHLPELCRSSDDDAVPVSPARAWNQHLRDPRPGFGIERCLYEANPGQACLSPPLRKLCVIELATLLPALEQVATTAPGSTRPVDRHVAAFIAARAGASADPLLPALGDAETAAATAMLGLLAFVQTYHQGPPLPHLAGWIGRALPPVLATFRNRAGRASLERDVRREIAGGDLGRLYAVVADPERRRRDREGFLAAVAAWEQAEVEIARLRAARSLRKRASEIRGGRAAAALAVSVATVSVCLSLVIALY